MKVHLQPVESGDRRFTVEEPPVSGVLVNMYDVTEQHVFVVTDKPVKVEALVATSEHDEYDFADLSNMVQDDNRAQELVVKFINSHLPLFAE